MEQRRTESQKLTSRSRWRGHYRECFGMELE